MSRSLVLGLGMRSVTTGDDLHAAIISAVQSVIDKGDDAGAIVPGIGQIAIWDRHREHPAVTALMQQLARSGPAPSLRTFDANTLAAHPGGSPSSTVAALTARTASLRDGLGAVAESAVLASGARLLQPKSSYPTCTVAIGCLAEAPPPVGAKPIGDPDDGIDLAHHGDAELATGLVDFAVNVAVSAPPAWLVDVLTSALAHVADYPRVEPVQAEVADELGVPPNHVLLVNGAAEAFSLLARARPWRRPLVVHPQFTEPEAALRAAGHRVDRHPLDAADGFRLHPGRLVPDADLVVIGNPTNPTSRLHTRADLSALRAPHRSLVVDEAFMDVVPGERESLLPHVRTDAQGVVVVRSLTKTFGLAGVRAGYVTGDPGLIAQMRRRQPPWSVNSLALAAIGATSTDLGREHVARLTRDIGVQRTHLVSVLQAAGLGVVDDPAGPFVLAGHPRADALRQGLRRRGIAVRRGDTFPGLSSQWLRVAVRERTRVDALGRAITDVLQEIA